MWTDWFHLQTVGDLLCFQQGGVHPVKLTRCTPPVLKGGWRWGGNKGDILVIMLTRGDAIPSLGPSLSVGAEQGCTLLGA